MKPRKPTAANNVPSTSSRRNDVLEPFNRHLMTILADVNVSREYDYKNLEEEPRGPMESENDIKAEVNKLLGITALKAKELQQQEIRIHEAQENLKKAIEEGKRTVEQHAKNVIQASEKHFSEMQKHEEAKLENLRAKAERQTELSSYKKRDWDLLVEQCKERDKKLLEFEMKLKNEQKRFRAVNLKNQELTDQVARLNNVIEILKDPVNMKIRDISSHDEIRKQTSLNGDQPLKPYNKHTRKSQVTTSPKEPSPFPTSSSGTSPSIIESPSTKMAFKMQVPSPSTRDKKNKENKKKKSTEQQMHRFKHEQPSAPTDLDIHVRFPRSDGRAVVDVNPSPEKHRPFTSTLGSSKAGLSTKHKFTSTAELDIFSSDDESHEPSRTMESKPHQFSPPQKRGPDIEALTRRMLQAEGRGDRTSSLPPRANSLPYENVGHSARNRDSTRQPTSLLHKLPAIQNIIDHSQLLRQRPNVTSRSERSFRRSAM